MEMVSKTLKIVVARESHIEFNAQLSDGPRAQAEASTNCRLSVVENDGLSTLI